MVRKITNECEKSGRETSNQKDHTHFDGNDSKANEFRSFEKVTIARTLSVCTVIYGWVGILLSTGTEGVSWQLNTCSRFIFLPRFLCDVCNNTVVIVLQFSNFVYTVRCICKLACIHYSLVWVIMFCILKMKIECHFRTAKRLCGSRGKSYGSTRKKATLLRWHQEYTYVRVLTITHTLCQVEFCRTYMVSCCLVNEHHNHAYQHNNRSESQAFTYSIEES